MVVFSEDQDAIHDLSSSDDRQTPVLMPPQIKLAAIGRPNIPEPNPVLDDANDNQAAEAQGDGGGHALMFGRYVGQISARVERASHSKQGSRWYRGSGPQSTCSRQLINFRPELRPPLQLWFLSGAE